MSTAVLCTPLRVEHAALRAAARSMRLIRTGMGPRRAARTAATLSPIDPVLIAGLAAAQSPHLHPGDLVVATEVRTAATRTALRLPNSTAELFDQAPQALLLSSGGSAPVAEPAAAAAEAGGIEIPSAPLLVGALRRLGLRVHAGPICSVARIAWGTVADGVLAVDMESAHLAPAGGPFAVVRAIVDTPEHPLWHIGTLHRGIAALRTLRAARPALEWWAAATGPRQVLVGAIAAQVDLVLVAGSPESPDSMRLAELAQRQGVPAYQVDGVSEIDLRWLAGRTRLSITPGAPQLVAEIVHCLRGLGPVSVREPVDEDVAVAASKEVI